MDFEEGLGVAVVREAVVVRDVQAEFRQEEVLAVGGGAEGAGGDVAAVRTHLCGPGPRVPVVEDAIEAGEFDGIDGYDSQGETRDREATVVGCVEFVCGFDIGASVVDFGGHIRVYCLT